MGVTHMEHVLVLTDQLERTRDFYRDVVGLAVGKRPALPFAGYWLYAGSTPCLHVAERRAYREHAATLGLEVDAGSYDPNGIRIELSVREPDMARRA